MLHAVATDPLSARLPRVRLPALIFPVGIREMTTPIFPSFLAREDPFIVRLDFHVII